MKDVYHFARVTGRG